MVWARQSHVPTTYNGQRFRSGLEAGVAEQLDLLGLAWKYECPIKESLQLRSRIGSTPPSALPFYLPDFLLFDEEMELVESPLMPFWIEVKPADMLYRLRDTFRIDEYFDTEVRIDCSPDRLFVLGYPELAKVQECAVATHEHLLVVSQLNRTRILSVSVFESTLVLSRNHPLANHQGHVRREQQKVSQARYEKEALQRQAERESVERNRQVAWKAFAKSQTTRRAKFGDRCIVCQQQAPANHLCIFRYEHQWFAMCDNCREE